MVSLNGQAKWKENEFCLHLSCRWTKFFRHGLIVIRIFLRSQFHVLYIFDYFYWVCMDFHLKIPPPFIQLHISFIHFLSVGQQRPSASSMIFLSLSWNRWDTRGRRKVFQIFGLLRSQGKPQFTDFLGPTIFGIRRQVKATLLGSKYLAVEVLLIVRYVGSFPLRS